MSQSIYKYLQTNFSQRPKAVDKLIISAFLTKNNLKVQENIFLKTYVIKPSQKNELTQVNDFIALIDKHFQKFDIETLIELFEFVISPSDRIVTGAVYTPTPIREFIVQNVLASENQLTENWTVADIACGCGGFLFTMAKHIKAKTAFTYAQIFRNNIYGLDIKQYAITRTKLLLSTLAISEGEDVEQFKFNLFLGDALNFNWPKAVTTFNEFNCLVGNPPYVSSRKIEARSKKHLAKYEVCTSGHPDLYIPFFQIAIELMKPSGFLGFITMNTFFKSLNGRALRAYFQKKKLSFKIFDFNTVQVFRKRSTYTCICLIQNTASENVEYLKLQSLDELLSSPKAFSIINYSTLKSHNGWNLLAANLINKIEAVGTPFSKKYKTRNGIATLKNEIYIFEPVIQDDDFYWLQNGNLYPIEKEICKEIVNPNFLTSQSDLSKIKQKFIFPYEFVDGKATIFTEARLKEQFPLTLKYLKEKKEILAGRDKGKGKYPKWFAFGRTQSLERMRYKLFFPHITPHSPNYVIDTDENLFFYNGIAVIGESEVELLFLKKLMSSRLFWFYLKHTSKPYTSGYISMSKNYIKDFGIYDFTEDDIVYVLNEQNSDILNLFFEEKYAVHLTDFYNDLRSV